MKTTLLLLCLVCCVLADTVTSQVPTRTLRPPPLPPGVPISEASGAERKRKPSKVLREALVAIEREERKELETVISNKLASLVFDGATIKNISFMSEEKILVQITFEVKE